MTTAPAVGDVLLSYPDPHGRLAGVALVGELWKRRPPVPFARRDGCWELRLPPPPVDRFEYELQLTFPDGRTALALDPVAPVAPGPFGDKSVLELPGYAEPDWVEREAPEGSIRSLKLPSARLRTAVEGLLWSPPGAAAAEPLPLLVVHDGPEYAVYSELIRFLDVATAPSRRRGYGRSGWARASARSRSCTRPDGAGARSPACSSSREASSGSASTARSRGSRVFGGSRGSWAPSSARLPGPIRSRFR